MYSAEGIPFFVILISKLSYNFLFYSVPKIMEEPKSLENLTPGQSAEFYVNATGTYLTYSWHRQTAKHPPSNEKTVSVGSTQTLYIDRVESSDDGYYVCTISNSTGGSVQTNPVQLTTSM